MMVDRNLLISLVNFDELSPFFCKSNMFGMESSLLLIEQQEIRQETPLLMEPARAEMGVVEQMNNSADEQTAAANNSGKWITSAWVNGNSTCERLFKALIPFKYRSETSKKEIVVWASDRQDADELYLSLARSSLCDPT
jgi:hypothetical protein